MKDFTDEVLKLYCFTFLRNVKALIYSLKEPGPKILWVHFECSTFVND